MKRQRRQRSITTWIELAGKDGTAEFEAVHGVNILEDFDPVGIL